ncbi:MAG: heavy metal-associated domain-containing protein [Bdellovibrionota bacterium]
MNIKKSAMHLMILGAILFSGSFAWAEQYKVKVQGMVCALCAQGIEKKLSKEFGKELKNVDVDLNHKIVSIDFEKEEEKERIKKAIEKAGYAVTSIEKIPDQTPASNGEKNQ